MYLPILLLSLTLASAAIISIPSASHLTTVQQRDEKFTINIDSIDTHTISVMPSADALSGDDAHALFVKFNLHAGDSSAACVGVFTDSISEGNLMGCMGRTCLNTGDVHLAHCPPDTSTSSVVGMIQTYEILRILVATTSKSIQTTLLFDMTFRASKPEAACPTYTARLADTGHIDLHASSSLEWAATVYATNTIDPHWILPPLHTVLTIPVPKTSPYSADLRLFVVCEECVQEIIIPNAVHRTAADLFEVVDFTLFMRAPSRKVVVGSPMIQPQLPWASSMLIVSIYREEDNSLVDSATVKMDESVTLNIDNCRGDHTAVMQVMYLEGVTVLTKTKHFNPATFCLNQLLPFDCFCDTPIGRRLLLDTSLWTAVQPSDVFTIAVPPAYPTESLISLTSTNLATVSSSMAVNLITGQTWYSNSTTLRVPMGVYSVYYALMPWEDLEAGYFSAEYGYNWPLVVVCQVAAPYAEFYPEFNYVWASTGVTCPILPREVSGGQTVVTSAQSVDSITWYYENETSPQDDCVETACFNPSVGTYRADIVRTIDGQQQQLSVFVTVESVPELSEPVYCASDLYAGPLTLTYNYLPTFETDHGAFATISMAGAAEGSVYWALQVTENGVRPANWLRARFPLSYPLHSGVSYSFRVMRIKYATSNIIATNVCYVDVGSIIAAPPTIIQTQAPIQTISCSGGTLIIFTVYCNIDIPYPPTAAVPINFYESGTDNLFLIAGPVELDPYVAGTLILTFKIGLHGQIVDRTLDDMLISGLYPQPVSFRVIDLVEQNAHNASAFHCGLDSDESMHQLVLIADNPTWLPQVIDNGETTTVVTSSGQRVTNELLIVNLTPIGYSGLPLTISTGLFSGISPIIANMCPMQFLSFEVPSYVPLDITTVITPPTQEDILCAGKRMFIFNVPGPKPQLISYKTLNDPDLGTVTVTDQSQFAVTVNRETPIVLQTYYNPTNGFMGARLPCVAVIDASQFASSAPPISVQPSVSIVSKFKATCANLGAGESGSSGGFMLSLQPASSQIMLVNEAGIPVLYRGYPRIPDNSVYIFSGLDTGMYTATSSNGQCVNTQILFIEADDEDGSDDDIATIVDMSATSSGTTSMLCPRQLYDNGNMQSWVQYYVVAFDKQKFALLLSHGSVITVDFWSVATGEKTATYTADTTVIKYRIPAPGTYVAEITVTNTHRGTACSKILDSYTVVDPLFTIDSFVMEVVNYPTCRDSTDGVIRISYPTTLSVDTIFLSCSNGCTRDATVDSSNKGFVFVSNLPFASALVFRYEVGGACTFDATYAFLPSTDMHPVISRLQYIPDCSPLHEIVAFAGQNTLLTYGNNKQFEWTINGAVVSDQQQLVVSPREESLRLATIQLTITYNGICKTTGVLNGSDVDFFVPPYVKVDQLLFDDSASRSLPVFCPNSADAMLIATIDPPCFDPSQIAWQGQEIGQATMPTPVTVAAAGLAAGTYTLTYTLSTGGLACQASDTAVVPAKQGYNVLSHIHITPAACAGGTATITLDRHEGHSDEISAFFIEMLPFPDRQYLTDRGEGALVLQNIPDGHVIRIMIPYPNKYIFRPKNTCPQPLVLDPGKIAPWPLLVMQPSQDLGIVMYVPPWHADIDVVMQETAIRMSQANSTCTETITSGLKITGSSLWSVTIDPVVQVLACPYSPPMDVAIYNVFVPTGDRFLKDTLSPLYFSQTLAAINPGFSLVYPQGPTVIDKKVMDLYCNGSPLMLIVIDLSIPEDTTILDEQITVDGHEPPGGCTLLNSAVACRINRMNSFYLSIPYISSTNGTGCVLTVFVYPLVLEAERYQPRLFYGVDRMVCIADIRITQICRPLPTDFGMVSFVSDVGADCIYSYLLPVYYYPNIQLPLPATAVQVIPPSCNGLSDGAIVWSTSAVQTTVSAGISWINYTVDVPGGSVEVWSSVLVPETRSLSYVIQPSALPPPAFKFNAQDMIAMPSATSAPLSITVYINGGSETTTVLISGTATVGRSSVARPACTVGYYNSIFWMYTCTAILPPGYSYQFDVSCGGVSRRRTHRLVPLPEFTVSIQITKQPASMYVSDGRARIEMVGGAPPFTLLFVDSTKKINLRYLDIDDLAVGPFKVSAIDSLGSTTSAVARLVPLASFDILSVSVISQAGCGAVTTSTVQLVMSSAQTNSVLIAAWNEAASDQAVAGCRDKRFTKPVSAEPLLTTVPSPGKWRFAICTQDGSSYIQTSKPLSVGEQVQTLSFTVVDGDICVTADGVVMGGGVDATVTFSGGEGIVSLSRAYNGQPLHSTAGSPFTLEARPAGIYHYTIQDSKQCPLPVTVRFRDGDIGPCGSCDFSDRSCLGCDGKPFSKIVLDDCGVCGGQNSCLSDCIITDIAVLEELTSCVSAGRTVTFTQETPLVGVHLIGPIITIEGPAVFSGDTSFTSDSTISLIGVVFDGANVIFSAGGALVTISGSSVYSSVFSSSSSGGRRRETRINIVFIDTDVSDTRLPTVTTTVVNSTLVDISIHETLVGNATVNLTFDYNSSMPTLNISAIVDNVTTIDSLACVLFESVPSLNTIVGSNNREFHRATFSCPGFGNNNDDVNRTTNRQTNAVVFLAITITMIIILAVMFIPRMSRPTWQN